MTVYMARKTGYMVVWYGSLLVHVWDTGEVLISRSAIDRGMADSVNRTCWERSAIG